MSEEPEQEGGLIKQARLKCGCKQAVAEGHFGLENTSKVYFGSQELN